MSVCAYMSVRISTVRIALYRKAFFIATILKSQKKEQQLPSSHPNQP
jgi:hypothetical protein